MILASSHPSPDGRRRLFVGLSSINVERLVEQQPIVKALDDVGVAGWDVVVMGPDDVRAFCAATNTPLPPDMIEEL
jgi:2-keto-3-deoxy-L-rhamnonate aldolase RhmA